MNLLCLGSGNMARALIAPLAKSSNLNVIFYSPSGKSAQKLAEDSGASFCEKLEEGMAKADLCVLACKPQNLDDLSLQVKDMIKESHIFISLLAGKSVDSLKSSLSNQNIVRLMPNTPSLVGKGVCLYHASKDLSEESDQLIRDLFSQTSLLVPMESEDLFDRSAGVTGSGPAYLFEFARIMTEYLSSHGLAENVARDAISRLFLGSALLMESSSESFETLRENVTSKKGITYEALLTFKEKGLQEMTTQALDAAYKRSIELQKS